MEEYRVTVLDNGVVEMFTLDRKPADPAQAYYAAQFLKEEYEIKPVLIYMACKYFADGSPIKIGITYKPQRREREFRGHIFHTIPCGVTKARLLERGIHAWLADYAIGNEWFQLPDRVDRQLSVIQTQRELRRFLSAALAERKTAGKLTPSGQMIHQAIERLEFY